MKQITSEISWCVKFSRTPFKMWTNELFRLSLGKFITFQSSYTCSLCIATIDWNTSCKMRGKFTVKHNYMEAKWLSLLLVSRVCKCVGDMGDHLYMSIHLNSLLEKVTVTLVHKTCMRINCTAENPYAQYGRYYWRMRANNWYTQRAI